jgi:hypothetical protein
MSITQPTRREVDPRIEATGGTRVRERTGYTWPGMMDEGNWRQTRVHRHTRSYSCARCGQAFKTPHAVYTHLAKRYGK